MLKIEFFSTFSEDPSIKIETDVFEAAGHKWRLHFHPNGNKEEEVKDHISLYLTICDTESLSKGWKVLVDVKFFVYDHIAHNYVTFQDRTRFHEKQTEWGFAKLISLEDFKTNSSGYIYNDSCVFGAEVFAVPEFTLKDRCLSMISPPDTMNTYTWTINNFSAITEKRLTSEVFKVGNLKWNLLLFPKGNSSGAGTSLSVYLKVHEAALFPDGWRVYAKYELRLKNQSGYADEVKVLYHWFCKSSEDWGLSSFMLLSELGDMSKGFLVDDKLIVEAKISIIGMLRNFI